MRPLTRSRKFWRFRLREDAIARAAHLRDDTALAWTIEYRPDTVRFHAAIDGRSSHLVAAAPGRHDVLGLQIFARLASPIRSWNGASDAPPQIVGSHAWQAGHCLSHHRT